MKTKLLLTLILCGFAYFVFAQDDPFAGRPTTPGAEVASDKENLPVKKETFTAKLERFKSEGFKVAVIIVTAPIKTKLPVSNATATTSRQLVLDGSLPSMASDLAPLARSFAEQMNKAFSTDIFEVVDLSTIPYREVSLGKVDDWGATIYKMIASYSITPTYDYNLYSDKYTASLTVNLAMYMTEYVNEKKGIKMKYLVRGTSLGFYKSPSISSDNNPEYSNIDELHAAVNPPMGADLVTELQQLQDKKMAKFIEKRKKK